MYKVSSCITERKKNPSPLQDRSVSDVEGNNRCLLQEQWEKRNDPEWKQIGGGLNVAACGSLIKIALGCICVSNEANQVHTNCQYIYFNFSTCFGQLCVHHQEKLLYLWDTGISHYG